MNVSQKAMLPIFYLYNL